MFRSLAKLDTPAALNAAHQAVRMLQWRVKPSAKKSRYVLKGVTSSPNASEYKCAVQLVREIQNAEGRDISELSPQKVHKYVVQISDLMQNRVKQETLFDATQG